ncbi:MAG: hypothetical protein F6K19_29550 [Cyanothece sp. SIO1E1]|nr:hypothetical protein [Cyanothece sp. SIO1E1]
MQAIFFEDAYCPLLSLEVPVKKWHQILHPNRCNCLILGFVLSSGPTGWATPATRIMAHIGAYSALDLSGPKAVELTDLDLRAIRPQVQRQAGSPPQASSAATPSEPADHFKGNVFSRTNPTNAQQTRHGVSLSANPSLGPQTQLITSIQRNLLQNVERPASGHDELQLQTKIRQTFSDQIQGEFGWKSQQRFALLDGEQLFNNNSIFLNLERQDLLTPQLKWDSSYQLSLSFANPDNRSQFLNDFKTSLSYEIQPNLQTSLAYQFKLTDFTQQDREDAQSQLTARFTYTLSPDSRISVFGGFNLGRSSEPNTNRNRTNLGADLQFGLSSNLQAALEYRANITDFTQQNREDFNNRLITRLTYTLPSSSRINLFTGFDFRQSSKANNNRDDAILGVSLDFNTSLF